MSGSRSKKLRKMVDQATQGQWDKMWETVYAAPLRRRIRIAYHVVIGR